MNTFAPSCDDAARKGSERGVAKIGENRIPFIPGATDITAYVAAASIENGRRRGRHSQGGANRPRQPFQQLPMSKEQPCRALTPA